MFDATINIGNLLQIVAMLVGGLFFLWRMEARLIVLGSIQKNFTERLVDLEVDIKKLSEITIEIARQDERMTSQDIRLNTIALRLDEMMKDRHFVTHPGPTRPRNKG